VSTSKTSSVSVDLTHLGTEQRNAKSENLHLLSPAQIIALISAEDQFAIAQAESQQHNVASLVELALAAVKAGNSIHYFGAGTSGRIAAQDAAELYPTFHCPPELVQAHIAGGPAALLSSVENAEDDVTAGRQAAAALKPGDVAIGLAASGRTPYVGAALARARELGAKTALISCVPNPELASLADVLIAGDTGPEILTGSTRLKAATFQKSVLSGFSTALMVGLGRTYSNLMVSMVATNEKLQSRSVRILMEGSGLTEHDALDLLAQSDADLKLALTAAITGVSPATAKPHLIQAAGIVHDAVQLIETSKTN
jgi:N-acetylmuramic acid 6-phosphate etherase